MNQQSPRRSVLHQILSILTRKALGQVKQQIQSPQCPAPADREAWRAYWKAQGQPWRSEPEIDMKRQRELAEHRAIVPDIEQGIYPFKGMKLERADVEWLLATHRNGLGPVDKKEIELNYPIFAMVWTNGELLDGPSERKGLDLRGADLRQEDLSDLPLTDMDGSLRGHEWLKASKKQREAALILLEKADLHGTHLEGAYLAEVHLEKAKLYDAHLEGAGLREAHLEETYLSGIHLEKTDFSEAHLEKAVIQYAHMEGTRFFSAHLKGATFVEAYMEGVDLSFAHLEDVNFAKAHMEGADLSFAHLENANFIGAHLEGAKLCNAFFDSTTQLAHVVLSNKKRGGASLVDIHWNDVNVAVIDWSLLNMLGDERKARQRKTNDAFTEFEEPLDDYQAAVRANRQLALVLQNQGLNEDAARFAYRAQVLQKTVFRLQMIRSGVNFRQRLQMLGAWLFSWFLFLLAGYGYKPWRSFLAYLLVIVGFATSYYLLGLNDVVGPHHVFGPYHLTWYEAIVVSMTAFHGRGFFANQFQPGDPQAFVAALEAFVGLIIEVTFIATLTRRLFGQ